MDWSKGYRATYYAMTVNKKTWADEDRIDLISGSINKEAAGLRGSAEFTSTASGFIEQLVRIYVDAVQNEDIEHIPIFTGYAVSPTIDINGSIQTQKYTCYSVLKPANDILLERGWYAPINTDVRTIIRNLLSVTKVPVTINGDIQTLGNYIVAEEGETNLTMIDKILKAINYVIVIKGNGEVVISPKSTKTVAIFGADSDDIVEPQFSISRDWYNVPNVLRVVMDDVSAIVKDEREESIYSTINRGREIWAEENSVDLANGYSLAQYANRRLKELQLVGTEASYTRRYIPNIEVNDTIELRYETLSGKYRIQSQKLSLGQGLKIDENVERLDTDIIFK